MKNIEVITKYFHPVKGGIETSIIETYSRLVGSGYNVTVHASKDTYHNRNVLVDKEQLKDIEVRRYKSTPIGFFPRINWRKLDYLVLHNFNIFPHFFILLYVEILSFIGKKDFSLIVSPHGGMTPNYMNLHVKERVVKRIINKLMIKLFVNKVVDKVRVVSRWEALSVRKAGVKSSIIYEVNDGIENEAFKYKESSVSSKSKKVSAELGKYIIQIGKIYPTKNYETTIKALKLVHDDIKLLIIGKVQDSQYKNKLKVLVSTLELQDRVKFVSKVNVNDKYFLLRKSILFVLTSNWESFGRIACEALSQGKVILVSDKTAPFYLLEKGAVGYKFNCKDPNDLASKILKVTKRVKVEQLIKDNITLAREYAWDNVADKFISLLESEKKNLKRKKSFVIINANNPKSIGVKTSLNVLVRLLGEDRPKIIIQTSNPENKIYLPNTKWDLNIYSYLLIDEKNTVIKLSRIFRFLFYVLIFKLGMGNILLFLRSDKLYKLCLDCYESDLVILMGTQIKSTLSIKVQLDYFLKLLLIYFASLSSGKQILLPITFGPFAYKWQKTLGANVVNRLNIVSTREVKSHDDLSMYVGDNLVESIDTSLMYKAESYSRKKERGWLNVGIGFRNWEEKNNYLGIDTKLTNAINQLAKKRKVNITPLFLDEKENESREFKVYKIFLAGLNKEKVKVNKPIYLSSQVDFAGVFSDMDMVVAPRTNIAMLAMIFGKPVTAFSTHKKLRLILDSIDYQYQYIEGYENANDIYQKIKILITNKNYRLTNIERINKLKKIEEKKWRDIFSYRLNI